MKNGSVLSRALISTIGMGVQGLARFVYTLAIGRLAGPESLGEVSALLSIAVYASLFWPAAAGVAASRFIPVAEASTAAKSVLTRSFAVSAVVLGTLSILAAWLLGSGAAGIFGTLALVSGYSAYVFVRGVLIGEDRICRATLLDTFASFLAITALVLVLLFHWNWALLFPLALSYAVFAVVSWPRSGGPVEPALRQEILTFTRDSAIALLATGGLLPATMVFVRAFETAQIAGLFAAGLSLATPANLVAQSVNQVLIPHFARMRGNTARAIRTSHLRIFLTTLTGFTAVFATLMACSPWVLNMFYGTRYVEGALGMQLMLAAVYCMSIMAAPAAYLVAFGRHALYARIWLVATTLGTILMIITSPVWGQWGALAGFLCGAVGGSGTVIFCALKLPPQQVSAAKP